MSDSVQTFGLNIHLVSFQIPEDLYGNLDEIRVGITTLPEHVKANYVLPASKISFANHVFTVNVQVPTQEFKDLPSNATQKIIVSFRKKSLFSNPLIASAIIRATDFPRVSGSDPQGVVCGEMKKIEIYETINQQKKEIAECQEKGLIVPFEHTDHNTIARKVIGCMEVQLSLAPPMAETKSSWFSHKSSTNYIANNNDSKPQSKKNSSMKLNSSSNKQNNVIPDTSYHAIE